MQSIYTVQLEEQPTTIALELQVPESAVRQRLADYVAGLCSFQAECGGRVCGVLLSKNSQPALQIEAITRLSLVVVPKSIIKTWMSDDHRTTIESRLSAHLRRCLK